MKILVIAATLSDHPHDIEQRVRTVLVANLITEEYVHAYQNMRVLVLRSATMVVATATAAKVAAATAAAAEVAAATAAAADVAATAAVWATAVAATAAAAYVAERTCDGISGNVPSCGAAATSVSEHRI